VLDESLVFHRTDLGVREAASAAHELPAKLRRALLLVDGEKCVADIAPAFRAGEIGAILTELQAGGYLTLAGGAMVRHEPGRPEAEESAPAAGDGDTLEAVRRRAMREISDTLGPNGDTLALRIERCATAAELRETLREAENILAGLLGADYGRSFAQKVGRDLL
jgi:hypothetical protein